MENKNKKFEGYLKELFIGQDIKVCMSWDGELILPAEVDDVIKDVKEVEEFKKWFEKLVAYAKQNDGRFYKKDIEKIVSDEKK